ncbi:SGNH/GDSL hydrolase family protein [Methylibium sp.]|uniref:SGNH/GDSL hydrolase family protein n=1 Tax=Methylibium sp. TaxID=2067992 RepID=UPI003D14427A
MKRSTRWLLALCGLGLGALGVHAQTTRTAVQARSNGGGGTAAAATHIDARWQESLEAFALADQAQAPQPGGVLFVGSSSIRLWSGLETQFAGETIVKRGFGGSRMFDCAEYLERLVLPYKPRLVIVYAGDNDLAEGRTPQQVLASFSAFVEGVRRALPDTRIAYLSIKPSPLRSALMPQVAETNALVANYSRHTPNLDYIDIYSKMLDEQGRPRAELFQPDALHLNAQGYALWRTVIADHLRVPEPPR